MSNESDDFSAFLGDDVKPIKNEARVTLDSKKSTQAKDVSQTRRRRAAVDGSLGKDSVSDDPLSSEPVDMVSPMSLLNFCRPGVQNGVFKNLRLGKYSLDARLDLHRLTVDQARTTLYRFIQDCIENDIRAALITHGKGEGRAKPALLKSCVAHWLPQMDEVLGFHTAQKQHGSYGATYVLLKKSSKKSLESREAALHKKF